MTIHPLRTIAILLSLSAAHLTPSHACGDDKELIAAVQKLNGYTSMQKSDGRVVLNIQFRDPGPNDGDIKTLRPLLEAATTPIGFNLNQCYNVTDAGIGHIEKLNTLSSVSLGNTKVTDAGLKSLAGLANLENLYLANDKLTDAGLAHLAKLTKLRKLSVYSKGITEAGYKHLVGLTNLEEINVGDSTLDVSDGRLEHMRGMTKLKKLSLGSDKLTDAGMAHVKNFTELQELRVEGSKVTPKGLQSLVPLKKLKKLTIMSCSAINGETMSVLKDMTELEELDFVYCGAIKPEASVHLKGLTSLKKLRFDSVHNEALTGIGELPKLERLSLFYSGVGDDGLKHLTGLKSMKDISLTKTAVTDAGLKHLGKITSSTELNLSENKITGEGLKDLAGLSNLKDLSLSECKISDAGLKDLATLSSLEQLSLSGCPVTDAGLEHLKGMTGLKNLNLTGTKVNDDAVLALKKAMPKTRIRDIAGDDVTLVAPKPRPRDKVEDLTKVVPDFKLTADALFKEHKDDRGATEKKYKNKVIELSGKVSGMGNNIYGDTYLSLEVPNDLLGVMCVMVDEAPWSKGLVPGMKIKIKGKWPEQSFGPALVYCVITESEKTQAITITAEGLAKEYLADKDAALKKYKDKYLIVTGEILDREFNSVGAAGIQLKTGNAIKLKCSFTAFEKSQMKELKVGQKLTLVGQFALNFGDDEIGVYFCHTIK